MPTQTDTYEMNQTDKSDSDKKVDDMEFQLLESNQEMSSIQLQLEESQTKVKELEKNLSSLEEKHTAQCSEASRGRKEQLERIAQLEEDISSRNNRCKELEVQLQNANTELRKAQEENETLKPQIEDLTSKLYSKENEFASMSDELKHIKAATLELQKQLQLSEAKSYNLTTDKTKLENEIAELMKSSGNNSERLTYLNGQLREKDRLIDEIKTSLAEAEADAGLLTGEIAQAKESYASDVDKLTKSHDEQIKKLTNQINSLEREHAKGTEVTTLLAELDQRKSLFERLSAELDDTKTQLKSMTLDRDSAKEREARIQDDATALQAKLHENTTSLDKIFQEQENRVKERDNLKERLQAKETEYGSLLTELNEHKSLVERLHKDLKQTKAELMNTTQDRDNFGQLANTKQNNWHQSSIIPEGERAHAVDIIS
ncbi:hypothetical protein QZH41_003471 [Actinostola sp. cb2023]|nr:hypothetical protein QZH41_003471 [Actinostola sp. cb2023]